MKYSFNALVSYRNEYFDVKHQKLVCLLGMFFNQFITLSVFFHALTFISSEKVLFIFCNMCLLILPISFFTGFSNLVVGRFKKFSLWSFNMMKLLPVSLISILSMMFAPLVCLIPSLFIFVAVHLSVFLYFDVIAFCKRL